MRVCKFLYLLSSGSPKREREKKEPLVFVRTNTRGRQCCSALLSPFVTCRNATHSIMCHVMHCWLLDAVGAVMQGFVVDQEGFYRFHCITQSTHTHKRVVVVTVKQTRERVAVLYPNNQQEQKSLWFHIHCVVFVFAHRILANPNNNITINVCISLCVTRSLRSPWCAVTT